MRIGMIFPGQGSQYIGMGKTFHDTDRIAQEFFELASSCLDQNFVRLCFASSERDLKETIKAQTSIFLVSAAIYTILNKKYGIIPEIVAGHSSGEYSAVFAAGGMSFVDSLYLLKKRASFMEEATRENVGGMLAVIGLSFEEVKKICEKHDQPESSDYVAQIVNFNAPEQFVVSGTLPELELIKDQVKNMKGRAIDLNVAGAFHSRLMKEAEKNFSNYLVKVDFKNLNIPLVNNVDAKIIKSSDEIRNSLVRQTSMPVLWWQSMQYFKDLDMIIQVGPGDKLAKLLKRQWPEKEIYFVSELNDLHNLLHRLDIEIKDDDSEMELDLKIEIEIEKVKKAANAEEKNKKNDDEK